MILPEAFELYFKFLQISFYTEALDSTIVLAKHLAMIIPNIEHSVLKKTYALYLWIQRNADSAETMTWYIYCTGYQVKTSDGN